MARKRAPGGGGGGGGFASAIEPILSMLLKQQMVDYENQAAQATHRENKLMDSASGMTSGIVAGTTNPNQMPPELMARLGFNPSNMRPSEEALAKPSYDAISGAKDFFSLPNETDIVSQFKGRDQEIAPFLTGGRETRAGEAEGELPSQGLEMASPPALQQAFGQRADRLDTINRAQEIESDRKAAEARANAYNTGMGQEDATSAAFPAELQRKLAVGTQENTLDFAKARGMGPIDAANEALKTPEAVRRAGLEAGSRKRAELDPDIIKAEVDRLAQMEKVRWHPGQRPTDASRRAQGFLIPLIRSDAGATLMENAGVGLETGTEFLGNVPMLNRFIDPTQRQYLQHLQNFSSVASLVFTGTTARADEYKRYVSTLFAFKNDDPVTIAQKQQARKDFMKSIELRASGSPVADPLTGDTISPQSGDAPDVDGMLQELYNRQGGGL